MEWGGWSIDNRIVAGSPPVRLSKNQNTIMVMLLEARGFVVLTSKLNMALKAHPSYLRRVIFELRAELGHRYIGNSKKHGASGYFLRKRAKNEAAELVALLERSLREGRRLKQLLEQS